MPAPCELEGKPGEKRGGVLGSTLRPSNADPLGSSSLAPVPPRSAPPLSAPPSRDAHGCDFVDFHHFEINVKQRTPARAQPAGPLGAGAARRRRPIGFGPCGPAQRRLGRRAGQLCDQAVARRVAGRPRGRALSRARDARSSQSDASAPGTGAGGAIERAPLLPGDAVVGRPFAGRAVGGPGPARAAAGVLDRAASGRGVGRAARGRLEPRRRQAQQHRGLALRPRHLDRPGVCPAPRRETDAYRSAAGGHGALHCPRGAVFGAGRRHAQRHLQPGRDAVRNAHRPAALRCRRHRRAGQSTPPGAARQLARGRAAPADASRAAGPADAGQGTAAPPSAAELVHRLAALEIETFAERFTFEAADAADIAFEAEAAAE